MENVVKIVTKISQIKRNLESILENDFGQNNEEKANQRRNFECSKDIGLIRGLSTGLPEDHLDRIAILFSRIALFFDAGIMMENNDSNWRAEAFFDRGVVETTRQNQKNTLKMPHVDVFTVLKAPSLPILKKLNLENLYSEKRQDCIMIKMTSDFAFILFSELPEIWQKDHVENIVKALRNGIAD